MGASVSINNNLHNIIYISYDSSNKDNIYIKKLSDELEKNNFNIVKTSNELILNNLDEYVENINKIINSSLYILVCVTNNSLKSFIQTIELNSILESNKKIIFIMTDKNYTPLSNKLMHHLVKKNKWYSLYDDETFDENLNNIKNDIFN